MKSRTNMLYRCNNFVVVLVVVQLIRSGDCLARLQQYNVDKSQITVSGISSGAAMAVQYHFAHSAQVTGAGVVAGVPYCCGVGGVGAADVCMRNPTAVNINFLISEAEAYFRQGRIDALSNIAGDKVFIFHGTKDSTVLPPSGRNVQLFYSHYGAQIQEEFSIPAEHGFPTNNHGAPCGENSEHDAYLNNCGYKGAFQILNYLYGSGLSEPSGDEGIPSNLLEYDQAEFFAVAPSFSSMDTTGFVYVPTACQGGTLCRLHISFHGCMQSRGNIQRIYATNAGFMEAAELNNVIVLFPQIVQTLVNPYSCWDWFGYLNNPYFPTKDGNQILGVYRMMNRVTG